MAENTSSLNMFSKKQELLVRTILWTKNSWFSTRRRMSDRPWLPNSMGGGEILLGIVFAGGDWTAAEGEFNWAKIPSNIPKSRFAVDFLATVDQLWKPESENFFYKQKIKGVHNFFLVFLLLLGWEKVLRLVSVFARVPWKKSDKIHKKYFWM